MENTSQLTNFLLDKLRYFEYVHDLDTRLIYSKDGVDYKIISGYFGMANPIVYIKKKTGRFGSINVHLDSTDFSKEDYTNLELECKKQVDMWCSAQEKVKKENKLNKLKQIFK